MTTDIAALVAELGTAARNMERALRSRMAGVNSLEARLMRQAAEALQSLQAERDEIERILKLRDQQLTDEIALSSKFASLWDTAQETIRRQREALEPFATFAHTFVDEEGWIGPMKQERIIDWFGPSDFRIARAALEPAGDER